MRRDAELGTWLDILMRFAGDLVLKGLRIFRRWLRWILAGALAGLAVAVVWWAW